MPFARRLLKVLNKMSFRKCHVTPVLGIGLPDAFCKNTGHFVSSAISAIICVLIRKRNRENRDNEYSYFGWLITVRCVCDVTIASGIASTAANKLH